MTSRGRAPICCSPASGSCSFRDPVAAFANLRGAVRQGGRLLCAAWRPLADNPWFAVPLEAARPLLPPQPPADPDAPGPFAFANHDRTREIVAKAGWSDVALTRHDVPMRIAAAGQLEQAVEFATRVGVLARMLAEADPDTHDACRLALAEALKPSRRTGRHQPIRFDLADIGTRLSFGSSVAPKHHLGYGRSCTGIERP